MTSACWADVALSESNDVSWETGTFSAVCSTSFNGEICCEKKNNEISIVTNEINVEIQTQNDNREKANCKKERLLEIF